MLHSRPATAGVIVCLSMCSAATAANEGPEDTRSVFVTATRYPMPLSDVLPATFVIDRAELERSLAPDITDILRFRTGLEIGRYGGPGQSASLFLRGTESNHTLVLVDGVRINPGTIGGAALQNISPELVERIEVVKGPRSTLYGTDAIGGVVQIFTHAGHANAFGTSIGYGANSTLTVGATGGWRSDRARIGFGINYLDSDGFPPRTTDSRAGAHDDASFNLAGSLDLGAGTLSATFWRAMGSTDYIGFSGRTFDNALMTQDYVNEAGAVSYGWSLGAWHSKLEIGRMVDDLDQGAVRDALGYFESTDYATTHRRSAAWQNDFDLSDAQRLSAGISVTDEKTRTHYFAGSVDTGIVNVYVQDRLKLDRHDMTLAVGYVDHDTAGSRSTWNAEYGFRLHPSVRLLASAGTAFRAPDATDRFGYGGNTELEPEESRNYEIGVRYAFGTGQKLSLSAFQNEIDQLITFVITDPITFDGQLQNIDRARIRGVELGYEIRRNAWQLRAEATYQDPEDRANGEQLLRRAKETFTLGYVQRLGAVELGVDVLAAGDRQDFGGVELDRYVLMNLSARLALGAGWSLLAQLENVLDENYELVRGYRTQDRAAFVGVRYTGREK